MMANTYLINIFFMIV